MNVMISYFSNVSVYIHVHIASFSRQKRVCQLDNNITFFFPFFKSRTSTKCKTSVETDIEFYNITIKSVTSYQQLLHQELWTHEPRVSQANWKFECSFIMDDYCFQTLAYISKYIVYHKVGRLLISYSLKKRYHICEYRIPKILLDNKIEKQKPSTNKSPTKLMSFRKNMERT